jgi:macrodomain Ter protein organizer (MatP/YcbG family)
MTSPLTFPSGQKSNTPSGQTSNSSRPDDQPNALAANSTLGVGGFNALVNAETNRATAPSSRGSSVTADMRTENGRANRLAEVAPQPQISQNALPTIDNFPAEYTIDPAEKKIEQLPWYAIVLGSIARNNPVIGESRTYREIRKHSKHIPLEVLYCKLIQAFQQPYYTSTFKQIPTHKEQLLFVHGDKERKGVFRPIPIEERDSLVAADIKLNGGRRPLLTEEKKEHLEILIQLKRRAFPNPNSPYEQIVSSTLTAVENVITDDMSDEDIAKHTAQIRDTCERYFPTTNSKHTKRKAQNLTKTTTPGQNNGGRNHLTTEEKKEHLEILIQLKRRAFPNPNSPYEQIVSSTLTAVENVITDDMSDEDIAKHTAQIRDTCERYFPTTNSKHTKRKAQNLTKTTTPGQNNAHNDNESKKSKSA